MEDEQEITADEFFRLLGRGMTKPFFGLNKPLLIGHELAIANRLMVLFDKHRGKNVHQINYSLLAEDTWKTISPTTLELLKTKQPVGDAEIKSVQKTARVAITSIYFALVQPENIPLPERLRAIQYFYQLLSAARQIYGVNLIEGQAEFLHQLVQHKNSLERK